MKNLNTKWVKPFIISLILYHHSVFFPIFFFLTYFHQPFLQAAHSCCCWKVLSHVWLFATPWTVAHQAPLCMGFPRQEYWSGLSFPSPGHLPDPGVKSGSLGYVALASRFFLTSATWETPAYSWVWLSDHHWFSPSTLICHIPSLFRESSYMYVRLLEVFPCGSDDKGPTCQCRSCKRCSFNPWVGKIPWRSRWQCSSILAWKTPWRQEPVMVHGAAKSQTWQPACTRLLEVDSQSLISFLFLNCVSMSPFAYSSIFLNVYILFSPP